MSTRQNNTHPVSRGVVGRPAHCHCRNRTCQECRDQADDMAAADLHNLHVRHSVMVHRHLAVVLCGGCEQPIDVIVDDTTTPTTITTQKPCGCRWGEDTR